MDVIDMRLPGHPSPDEGDRSYALIAPEAIYVFRYGEGNRKPWNDALPFLSGRLSDSPNRAVGDLCVSVDGSPEITIDEALAEDRSRYDRIAESLVSSGICGPCTPVAVAHSDGTWTHRGALVREPALEAGGPSFR